MVSVSFRKSAAERIDHRFDFRIGENFIDVYQRDLRLQGEDIIRQIQGLSSPTEIGELADQGQELINWKRPDKHIFIFQFSFLASFIGVFLQMMLQGVSITKSE